MRNVNVYGVPVTISDAPRNDYVFDGCERQNWKPELYALLARALRPELTFIDLGAFVGSVSLYAAATCKSVISVEADPVCASVLRSNVGLNPALAERIEIIEAAVSDKRGTALFGQRGGGGSGIGGTNFAHGGDEALELPAITLSDLVRSRPVEPPYFLKVNLQGAEGRVLSAAEETLRRDMPTLHVYVRPVNWSSYMDAVLLARALALYPVVTLEDGTPFAPELLTYAGWNHRHDFKLVASKEALE